MAVVNDHASVARCLLRAGADPKMKWGLADKTALQVAKERGAATCVSVIEEHLAAELAVKEAAAAAELAAKEAAAAAELAAKEVEAARHAKELLAEIEAEERCKGKKSKKKKNKGGGAGTTGPPQEQEEATVAAEAAPKEVPLEGRRRPRRRS